MRRNCVCCVAVQSPLLLQWEANGEAKIVVGVENAEELLALISTAHSLNADAAAEHEAVASTVISDAGRTQVAAGSVTVAAFLGTKSRVDAVTGQLRLL